jgi:DNA-binding transcriptional regulator YiaG
MSRKPEPAEIVAARKAAGLTQTAAASLVHADVRTWQAWEGGTRQMPAAKWELFRLKLITMRAGMAD